MNEERAKERAKDRTTDRTNEKEENGEERKKQVVEKLRTKKPVIILLSGWAGSGKDTVANILCKKWDFVRLAFADELKWDVSQKTGLPLSFFHSEQLKDKPLDIRILAYPTAVTPRDLLLQHAKREREKNPFIYCEIILDKIADSTSPRIVISDWRYKKEFAFLSQNLDYYFTILRFRVHRSCITPSPDASEHDLDDEPVDSTLFNDGSLPELTESVSYHLRDALMHVVLEDSKLEHRVKSPCTDSEIQSQTEAT
jgi:hypothetical protein